LRPAGACSFCGKQQFKDGLMSKLYRESHEWIEINDGVATIGISTFAAGEVGEVIHVELPDVGASVGAGEAVAEIESVKSVNDIYSPVSGTISAVNDAVSDNPELVNSSPDADGWLFKVTCGDDAATDGLMDQAAYDKHISA
jgi:glycine cleavage system H protein